VTPKLYHIYVHEQGVLHSNSYVNCLRIKDCVVDAVLVKNSAVCSVQEIGEASEVQTGSGIQLIYRIGLDANPPAVPYVCNDSSYAFDEICQADFLCEYTAAASDLLSDNIVYAFTCNSWMCQEFGLPTSFTLDQHVQQIQSGIDLTYVVGKADSADSVLEFPPILMAVGEIVTFRGNIEDPDDPGHEAFVFEVRRGNTRSSELLCTGFFAPLDNPIVEFVEPRGNNDSADESFNVVWDASDLQGDALEFDLYYDVDQVFENGGLVNLFSAQNQASLGCGGDTSAGITCTYLWDTESISNGTYYLYVVAREQSTSENLEGSAYSDSLVISHVVVPDFLLEIVDVSVSPLTVNEREETVVTAVVRNLSDDAVNIDGTVVVDIFTRSPDDPSACQNVPYNRTCTMTFTFNAPEDPGSYWANFTAFIAGVNDTDVLNRSMFNVKEPIRTVSVPEFSPLLILLVLAGVLLLLRRN
jgi:hypothetical protein